jgi:hypothetical protein
MKNRNHNDDVAGKLCSYQSDCGTADDFYCDISARRCKVKKPLGQACSADFECAKGTCGNGKCYNLASIVQAAQREADKAAARARKQRKDEKGNLTGQRIRGAFHFALVVLVVLVIVAAVAVYIWKRIQKRKRDAIRRNHAGGIHPSISTGSRDLGDVKEKAGKITQSPLFVMPAVQPAPPPPPTYRESVNERTPEEPPPQYQSSV